MKSLSLPPPEGTRPGSEGDDPELSEYLVRVDWLQTFLREWAIWEKGMFANQNTACELRNKFALDRLAERLRPAGVALAAL